MGAEHHVELGPYSQSWIRFVNSNQCLCIYLVLMIINVFILVLEFMGKTIFDTTFVIVCEAVINSFLTVEVVAGLAIYRLRYFKRWYHSIDFLLTALCWIFYLMFLGEHDPGKGGVMDLEVETILLGFRYCFQTARFVFVFVQSRRKRRIINVEDVKFPAPGVEGGVDAPIDIPSLPPVSDTEEEDDVEDQDDPMHKHKNLFSKSAFSNSSAAISEATTPPSVTTAASAPPASPAPMNLG